MEVATADVTVVDVEVSVAVENQVSIVVEVVDWVVVELTVVLCATTTVVDVTPRRLLTHYSASAGRLASSLSDRSGHPVASGPRRFTVMGAK